MLSQEDIAHQQELLTSYRERLAVLLNQQAIFGAHTPPYVFTELKDAHNQIRRIEASLRKSGIVVEDHTDDDLSAVTPLSTPPPGNQPPPDGSHTQWHLIHPFPISANFTGREAERERLSKWLEDSEHPLLVLRALGGFGKSSLSWHWLHNDVLSTKWPRVVWWSFYRNSDFEEFLREILNYLSSGSLDLSSLDARKQMDKLLERLREDRILLILDGFERALWAYSGISTKDSHRLSFILRWIAFKAAYYVGIDYSRKCVNPLAGDFLECIAALPKVRGKVLMTTRLHPRPLGDGGDLLPGCLEMELGPLLPGDAVKFFQAQGIGGSEADIEQAAATYGYHPLSLRVLSSDILSDPEQPGDIAVAPDVNVLDQLMQRRHDVLAQPYEALTSTQRRLLNRIAQHEGLVPYSMFQNGARGNIKADLRGLVASGLVRRTQQKLYDLHPIVRLYVRRKLVAIAQESLRAKYQRFLKKAWYIIISVLIAVQKSLRAKYQRFLKKAWYIIISVLIAVVITSVLSATRILDHIISDQPQAVPLATSSPSMLTASAQATPEPSLRIDVKEFLIRKGSDPSVPIKPNQTITGVVGDHINITAVLFTNNLAADIVFHWETCRGDSLSRGEPKYLYVVPTERNPDCIRLFIEKGGQRLGEGAIKVNVVN